VALAVPHPRRGDGRRLDRHCHPRGGAGLSILAPTLDDLGVPGAGCRGPDPVPLAGPATLSIVPVQGVVRALSARWSTAGTAVAGISFSRSDSSRRSSRSSRLI